MALLTWAFMAGVLVIVVVLVVLRLTQGSTTTPAPALFLAPDAVVHAVSGIPPAVFDAVGAPASSTPPPQVLSGQPVLTMDGHPEVVFVGAQFSPYSAAARWAVVAALSRFGSFTKLGATSSSAAEVFGHTPTFNFSGSSYRSSVLTFTADETYGDSPSTDAPAGFPVLQTPSGPVGSLLRRYDGASAAAGPVALPFLDVGNQVLFLGAGIGFSPSLLHGQSLSQVAADLSDPTSAVGQAVVGAANEISAAVCRATAQRPTAVCSSSGVRAAAARLGVG